MCSRIAVIKDLIGLRGSIDQLSEAISDFEWDFEGEPEELREEHLYAILSQYLTGKITGSEVYRWANLIEGRDDIDYDRVADEIHILANPELTEPLSRELATRIIGVQNGA